MAKKITVQAATARARAAAQAATQRAQAQAQRNAQRASQRAAQAQTRAVRSATSSTRSSTLRKVEKNMGGVQRVGRSIDRGVSAVKGAIANAQTGNTAWQKGANKAVDTTKRVVKNFGSDLGGYQLGADTVSQRGAKRGTVNTAWGNMKKTTVRNVGYGVGGVGAAAIGGTAKVGYDIATGLKGKDEDTSSGSSWSQHKNTQRSSGFRGSPNGL